MLLAAAAAGRPATVWHFLKQCKSSSSPMAGWGWACSSRGGPGRQAACSTSQERGLSCLQASNSYPAPSRGASMAPGMLLYQQEKSWAPRAPALHPQRPAAARAPQRPGALAAAAAGFSTSSSGSTQASAGLQGHPVVYHTDFQINPIQDGHRFPMPKDHLLYCRLQELGLAGPQNTFTPLPPDEATLCLAHSPEYVRSFMQGTLPQEDMRRIGLPWSPELVTRTLIGVGSAVLAARLALQYGVAIMCNGGTHHAHRSHGSGWCIFNDQAVAARAAQRDAGVGKVMFVDLDVHQGDGTATIFAGDPSVFTFSVHCGQQGFPRELATSSLDIALPAGTGDEEYLRVVRENLPGLLRQVQPDLVMYNAGVDVHSEDALGKLALSTEGIQARDRLVMSECAQLNIPVAAAIGGGYQPDDHMHIVERHVCLHRAAAEALPLFLQGRAAKLAQRVRRRSSAPAS